MSVEPRDVIDLTLLDPHCIYARTTENLAAKATTITLQGCTAAAGYDPRWLADGNIARPLRLNEPSGRIIFSFPTYESIRLVALGHANLAAGLEVHVKALSGGSWTAPAFDTILGIPPWRVGGVGGRYPGNPWRDLSLAPAWGGYSDWAIDIVGTNPVPITIGEIWLGTTLRRLNPDFIAGRKPAIDQPRIEHATAYRKLRSQMGTMTRSVTGSLPPGTDDAIKQDVLEWFLDADGRAFLFIPDGTKREAWWAIHTTTRQELEDWLDHDASSLTLTIEEDGRGLEPTPSPLPPP